MKKPTHNTKKFGAKIQEYKDKEQSDIEASELVKNELQQANTILGNTDVEGEGIVVTLRETNTEETGVINANDLLDIVNELKNAGAEAISINGQRIVANSVIDCDGSVIRVNGVKIGAPFEIKAIGLQETLVMVDRYGGYLWSMREEWLLEAELKRADNITIPKYSGVIKFEYAESE